MLELCSGDFFAGCKIIGVCGTGGYGTVYLAENAAGEKVALKIINTNEQQRELEGIKNYMPVSHQSPYLLKVFHVGVEQNELFLIMEAADTLADSKFYLPDTLAKRLQLYGRLQPDSALDITRKISSAVKILHDAKLIHRDIKPDNIIFVDGEPKLSDPGLVCSSERTITLVGTLGFLPPECFYGNEGNSIQSDIYALGKVFYCMITGESPGRYPYLPRDLSFPLCRKLLPILLKSCNTKKKKRYESVSEFQQALPEKLPRPSIFLRYNEKFRIWRLMNEPLWNGIVVLFLAAILLTVFLCWTYQKRQEEQQKILRNIQSDISAFRKKTGGEKDFLALQLEGLYGSEESRLRIKNYNSLPTDPAQAHKLCQKYIAELRSSAILAAEKNHQIPDAFRRAANKRAFLKSPLAVFLTEKQKKELQAELKKDEKQNAGKLAGALKLEQKFYPDSSGIFEFAYIPPGDYISPTTGKRVHIPYPFWVAPDKLSVRQFSRMCRFLPPGSKKQEAAAVRFLWNDLLHGCRNANDMFQIAAPFTPGYIVRPLSEEEWEYCVSRNKKNGKHTSNAFGLSGMDDKIYEMLSSGVRESKDARLARSAGLKNSRLNFVFYQSFMKNVGTRIAIAPGNREFYNITLQTGTPQHLYFNGKHYEFFGHLCANFKREEAERICRLLGGKLASLDSPELIREINRVASPVILYNICVAADFRDGKWYWKNGKEIQGAPPAPKKEQYFILSGKKFRLTPTKRFLGFICEWTPEEYRERKNWKKRFEKYWPRNSQKSFHIDGKEYLLLRFYMSYPHLCRRFAEILGGKLAEPQSPVLRKRIWENIKNYNERATLLGGYWHHEKYYWFTGKKEITEPLPSVGQVIDSAPSLFTPALHNGNLCVIQLPEQFLIEFPVPESNR